jgi:hypothetical protein
MEWGSLTISALAMTGASTFIRWRFPSVPNFIASAGIAASFAIAIFSVLDPGLLLASSLALNAGLVVGILDYWRNSARSADASVLKESRLERERIAALKAIASGRMSAAIARTGRPIMPAFQGAIPNVRAAILTAHKQFGIPILPESGDITRDVDDGGEFIAKILPLLEQGHLAEAKDVAISFIAERSD